MDDRFISDENSTWLCQNESEENSYLQMGLSMPAKKLRVRSSTRSAVSPNRPFRCDSAISSDISMAINGIDPRNLLLSNIPRLNVPELLPTQNTSGFAILSGVKPIPVFFKGYL